jgi:omega-hydroxy-beta-dihydromenaquinone-9 sulfotransferase
MFLLGSFSNWIKILWRNKGCDRGYVVFTAVVTLLRLMTTIPRLFEKILFSKKINSTPINHPPVFIIGHWRSGTTYLHSLMIRDENLGHMTMLQAVSPQLFLVMGSLVRKILAWRMPETRPMDNLPMSPDVPQEEEFAMANATGLSFYLSWIFPRNAREYFGRFALFEDIPSGRLRTWKKRYLGLLRKITMVSNGRRLVLKNPVNTGRIPILLELFPDARFIHIYRNPIAVYPSTLNLYDKMLGMCSVQHVLTPEIEEYVLSFYESLMKKYFYDKHLIPKKNLVEVKFEDMESDPMNEVRRIYEHLRLPGFELAEDLFAEYIGSLKNYQKNSYHISPHTVEKLRRRWQFSFDTLGYNSSDEP